MKNLVFSNVSLALLVISNTFHMNKKKKYFIKNLLKEPCKAEILI